VLRFWNHQVRQELDSVWRSIWFAFEERQKNNPHLHPLPLAKGEVTQCLKRNITPARRVAPLLALRQKRQAVFPLRFSPCCKGRGLR
jgi:hypothetical protein